jgi:hypothetical protein
VVVNDAPLTTFHHGGTAPPHLAPLTLARAAGDAPRVSCRIGHGDVNGVDVREDGDGRQRVTNLAHDDGDAYGWIRAEIAWEDAEGEPVLAEVREYRFYATPASSRMLDVTSTLTAAHGDVVFGGARDAGFFVVTAGGGAAETTGDGGWRQLAVEADAGALGVAVFAAPGNPNHPPAWVTEPEGTLAANPFAGDDGAPGHRLPAGETLTLRYRVLLHAGGADAAGRYNDFAEPPRARWLAP